MRKKKRLAQSKSPAVEWCLIPIDAIVGISEMKSIPAELKALNGELFADFVEAGHAKVLAFE